MPIGASSNTRQPLRRHVELPAGLEEHVGRRLAARHLIAAHDDRERVVQADLVERVRDVQLGRRGGQRHGDAAASASRSSSAGRPATTVQAAARQLPIQPLLLVLVGQPLVARHLAAEQQREDLAVAPAVELGAVGRRERRQPVALGERRERLGVQRHVVDDGAVEVEDDGAGAIGEGHEPLSPEAAQLNHSQQHI